MRGAGLRLRGLAGPGALRRRGGRRGLAARYRTRAADLRTRFNRDFWLEDRGWLAVGLDVDKDPIDALASNMGHCLWTGILDEDKAAIVAERLLSPELFSGWGVRTLRLVDGGLQPAELPQRLGDQKLY